MADTAPWLVVGLGNPGSRYAKNRHNVGFMAVESWVSDLGGSPWREKWKARIADARVGSARCVAMLPQTYMNRSGESVVPAVAFHHVPAGQLVVVHDELDFAFGRLAIKHGGGHGGHNGLRDLVAKLGFSDFVRVRVGIGRPTHGDVSAWVLSDFAGDDLNFLPDLVDRARSAVTAIIRDGVAAAMNLINSSTPT